MPSVLLMMLRHIRVPQPVRQLAMALSGAACTIYLTHNFVIWLFGRAIGRDLDVAMAIVAIAISYGLHAATGRAMVWLQPLIGRRRSPDVI